MLKRFTDLISTYAKNGSSDVHICGGQPIIYRQNGSIKSENKITWSHQDVDTLIQSILNAKNMAMLRDRWSVDFAASVANVRIRINIFNSDRGTFSSHQVIA
jgi:twitching motility protein PilT